MCRSLFERRKLRTGRGTPERARLPSGDGALTRDPNDRRRSCPRQKGPSRQGAKPQRRLSLVKTIWNTTRRLATAKPPQDPPLPPTQRGTEAKGEVGEVPQDVQIPGLGGKSVCSELSYVSSSCLRRRRSVV